MPEITELKSYIGTKIIRAAYSPCQKDVYKSKVGDPGYLVEYENGYRSWSPKDIFEKAYRRVDNMNFGLAIEAMRKGHKVARKGWNGKGIFIALQTPDKHSKMTAPYIYIDTTDLDTNNDDVLKAVVPWLASQTDMLAEDWFIVS